MVRGWRVEPTVRTKCQFFDCLHSPNPDIESISLRRGYLQREFHIATDYAGAAMAYATLRVALGLIHGMIVCPKKFR
jgi:hypothetical protein